MSQSKKPKKDEVAVLLSEIEVGGHKIKPWSFGKFKKVYPTLIGVIPTLKNLDLKNVEDVMGEKGLEAIGGILPAIGPMIATTLDVSEEEVDGMDLDRIALIGLTIIAQNLSTIKNSFPLVMEQVKTLIRGT